MGSVRLEESGEWSGGVPECRTAHAAHQQRVERGGRRLSFVFKAAKEFSQHLTLARPCPSKTFFLPLSCVGDRG